MCHGVFNSFCSAKRQCLVVVGSCLLLSATRGAGLFLLFALVTFLGVLDFLFVLMCLLLSGTD